MQPQIEETEVDEDALSAVVLTILFAAAKGKGEKRHGLCAYQILARMPKVWVDTLVAAYAKPGKGSGAYYSAASAVSRVVRQFEDVKWTYADTRDMYFRIHGDMVQPSYPVCAFYRVTAQ